MTDLGIDFAQQVLDEQPFSRLLGARITAFADGAATLEVDIRDDLRQQYGYAHGGLLAYAADNALTFAAGTVLGPAIITGGFSVQYLRPARDGTLRAEAYVVHGGRRQAVCRCDVYVVAPGAASAGAAEDGGAGGELCAVAQGTILTAPQRAES
ncbi:PaaI family thioesterase [Streptomyces sp. WMMC500]|uniref:PaaI family thioesterase n=1 Tax=Streptomyces sp. WMMC500 TaxID=3015154 RepID=UPI00248C7822|nr:PaaI family thioesterase [Streptomyces sp. WMMC500]WBB62935.1 PaaI family thioesterase [Streptomyces sp. WMMC500]